MKTLNVKVYLFNELPEKSKEKVLNKNREINLEHNWWGCTYGDAKEIGLKITSFDLDRNRHAEGEFLLAANEVAQNILNNHGEHCETYKTAQSFMEEWQPVFTEYMNEDSEKYESRETEEELQEIEDNFLQSLLEDYSILLQNEYEYLMTDEAVQETLIINEYTYLEDGTEFNI